MLWTTLAGAVFGMLLIVPGLARAEYRFTTIDPPGAINSAANGNSLFEIVGEFDDKDGNTHGFVLTKGVFKKDVFTTIDVPGAAGTSLNGINVFGRLVGTYFDPPGPSADPPGRAHCFVADKAALAKKGAFTTLDPPGSTRSQGGFVNSLGQVVGAYRDGNSESKEKRRGFIWFHGKFTKLDINVPNDDEVAGTVALGINDFAQVVGNYVTSGDDSGRRHGFLWSRIGNSYKNPIDAKGADITIAQGINNAGTIVGVYVRFAEGLAHGFVLSKGVFTTVDVPGSLETEIRSINSKGEIVGVFTVDLGNDKTATHGFLGTPER